MAAGDVSVEILDPVTADVDTAVTNARVTANDKFYFVSISNGLQIMFIHIEEA